MIRWLSFTGTLITLLFAVCISLIQAQPYNSSELATTLLGDSACPQPCWHNIRPGHTTLDEALTLLAADSWVGQITRQGQRIEWSWTGQQPALVNASQPGWLTVDNQAVSAINIPTTVSMGDLYFLLGTPYWKSTHRSRSIAHVRLSYPREYLALTIVTQCPTTRSIFWLTRPDITLLSQPPTGIDFDIHLLSRSIDC